MQIILAAGLCEIVALLVGAAGGCGLHVSLLGGLSQGAAAFGNSGMAMGRPFSMNAWQTHLFVLPMVFLGGLGITVLMELYDLAIHGQPLSTHSRTVLTWGIGLYLVSVIALTLIQWIAADWLLTPEKISSSLASSSVMALNSRTAGIPYQYVSAFPRAMQWLVMALMMIGAAPGGTGGGLKITTLAILVLGMRRLLRGESPGRSLGIAMSWLGIYLSILLLGLVMLLFVEPQLAGDQVLFMAISALSNVGMSYDQLPDMPRGSFVLAALMLAGRMTPLLVLWWMADSTQDAEIAVG
jgi:trk system potassium uptake protein TrkH